MVIRLHWGETQLNMLLSNSTVTWSRKGFFLWDHSSSILCWESSVFSHYGNRLWNSMHYHAERIGGYIGNWKVTNPLLAHDWREKQPFLWKKDPEILHKYTQNFQVFPKETIHMGNYLLGKANTNTLSKLLEQRLTFVIHILMVNFMPTWLWCVGCIIKPQSRYCCESILDMNKVRISRHLVKQITLLNWRGKFITPVFIMRIKWNATYLCL